MKGATQSLTWLDPFPRLRLGLPRAAQGASRASLSNRPLHPSPTSVSSPLMDPSRLFLPPHQQEILHNNMVEIVTRAERRLKFTTCGHRSQTCTDWATMRATRWPMRRKKEKWWETVLPMVGPRQVLASESRPDSRIKTLPR